MLAFGILNLNMNSGKRFFDITLEQKHFTGNPTNVTNSSIIPFVPCKKSKWTGINEQIDQSYDNLKLDELYCAQTESKLELEGRWSSGHSQRQPRRRTRGCTIGLRWWR